MFSKKKISFLLAMIFSLLGAVAPAQTTVYYVDAQRPDDSGNGRSWATARRTVQSAIDATSTAHQVWVRAGTYREALTMRSGAAVYGGFGGGEADLTQRDPAARVTTLDAATARGGQPAYHAVKISGVTSTTLDGLTIRGGNSSDLFTDSGLGGGIYLMSSGLTLANCILTSNSALNGGSAIECYSSTLTVRNCIFDRNSTPATYGALDIGATTSTFTDCTVSNHNGLGFYSYAGQLTMTRCAITGSQKYGGVCLSYQPVTVTSCTIANNQNDTNGGGVFVTSCTGLIQGCTFANNCAEINGGGIFITGSGASGLTFEKCSIIGNKSNNGLGGGLCLAGTLPAAGPILVKKCIITGNVCTGTNNEFCGAGVATFENNAVFDGCVISGNSAVGDGGGLLANAIHNQVVNCILSGNSALKHGGAIYSSFSSGQITLTNCTIDGNSSAQGGGFYLASSSPNKSKLSNVILSHNIGHAVQEPNFSPLLQLTACLFDSNPDGDYYDSGKGVYSGGDAIMTRNTGAQQIFSSPLAAWYVMDGAGATTGTWSAAPVYDAARNLTRLAHGPADWTPGALAGHLIDANTSQRMQNLVTSNTATTLWVVGDATAYAAAGDTYKLVDYHVLNGSGSIDCGVLAGAPDCDLEGAPRPGSDGLVDLGAYESPASYKFLDIFKPQSAVAQLPLSVTTSASLVLNFTASDLGGVVQYVQLYYRHAGGPWTRYGDRLTTAPIAFDTTQTGGEGAYEFYTRAVDDSGNVEDAPASADAVTWVISQPYGAPRVYVAPNATGTGLGNSWANACTSVSVALQVALNLGLPEVWVAQGSYSESITMPPGVALYGGFAGGETALAQRNPAHNATIIDGSKALGGLPAPHVVTMIGITTSALDGFTICGGNNTSTKADSGHGGGIFCRNLDASNLIANCVITGNHACMSSAGSGGGAYLDGASPSFVNCSISLNTACVGGGLYCTNGSSPRLDGCTVHGNTAASTTGGMMLYKGSSVLTRCTFSGNSASTSYAALCINGAQTTLTACTVAGNTANDYGGIYANGSRVALNGCVISGNSSSLLNGPLTLTYNANATLANTVISGNAASRSFAVGLNNGSITTMTQCTIDSNLTTSTQGALMASAGSTLAIRGSIISRNPLGALSLQATGAKASLSNSLLFANTAYDYKDASGKLYNGADNLSLHLPNVVACIGGDPCFASGASGRWTASAAYDATGKTTLLSDAAAALTPGALRGKLINPATSQTLQALVLDNTTTTILVAGNLAAVAHLNDPWTVMDYHLKNGSPALDQLDPAQSLSVDIDGDARPGADGRADLGADEAAPGFTPVVVPTPPHSAVKIPSDYITTPVYSIPFGWTGGNGPIAYVRLFYSRNGGPWTQYPDAVTTFSTAAPTIRFDSTLTGGDGPYVFYTLATDAAGNTEAAKSTPDDGAIISSQKVARIYVNKAAQGLGTGTSWTDACTTIGTAMSIAHDLKIPEVWAARGVYTEALTPPNAIALYGGFAGGETQLNDRVTTANLTVIDPRRSATDTLSGHPLTINSLTSFRIDGFTLQGGYDSSSGGGGVYCIYSKSNIVIANCTIVDNKTLKATGTSGEGGGLWLGYSKVLVDSCIITRNQGYLGGGVRCNQSTATLTNCQVNGNSAWQGGGVSIATSLYTTKPPVVINRCAIQANAATATGGGVFCDSGTPVSFANCLVTGNSATDGGGFLLNAASPTLAQCTIADNLTSTAAVYGGGITGLGNSSPSILNTAIVGNVGYGIGIATGKPTFNGCLSNGNSAGDSMPSAVYQGRYITSAMIFAAASLQGSWFPAPVYNAQTNLTTFYTTKNLGAAGSLVGRVLTVNTSKKNQALVVDNTSKSLSLSGNWTALAHINDLWSIKDYRQGLGSPGLDNGTNAGETLDLDGNPRPVDIRLHGAERSGAEFDIGAYEAQSIKCVLTFSANGGLGSIVKSPNLSIFEVGSTVTLTALPAADYYFGYWSGNVPTTQTTSNPFVLTMDSNKTISAVFLHETGTVVVRANVLANWSFTASTGCPWGGNLISSQTVCQDVPTGVVTMTWGSFNGYDLPNPAVTSQTLTKGGTITFYGNYQVWTGALDISVVPPQTGWSLRDSQGATHSGTGNTCLTGIPFGNLSLTWSAPNGYRAPLPSSVTAFVAKNKTTYVSEVLDPVTVAASAARHSFNKVLYYLLGSITEPTGLDLNADSQIDAADLVASVGKLPPPTPASPSPIDGTVLTSTEVRLSWVPCARAQSYNVYFWKSGDVKGNAPLATVTSPTYAIEGQLVKAGMRYYWQVEAVNGSEVTAGPAWTFRITSPSPY